MSSELALKLNGSSGEIQRMVAGTDFLPESVGGTGEVTFAQGDLLQGDASSGLTKLTVGTAGQVLTSDGTSAGWVSPAIATDKESLTNDETGALSKGNVVYAFDSGGIKKAKADAGSTANAIGISLTATAAAGTATVQTSGVVTLDTSDWDGVTGDTGGLVANSWYFLSAATAGNLTATPPNTTGQKLLRVGKALSSNKLQLLLQGPYGL